MQLCENFTDCLFCFATFAAALDLFEKFFHLLFVYDAFLPFDTILSGTDNGRKHTAAFMVSAGQAESTKHLTRWAARWSQPGSEPLPHFSTVRAFVPLWLSLLDCSTNSACGMFAAILRGLRRQLIHSAMAPGRQE